MITHIVRRWGKVSIALGTTLGVVAGIIFVGSASAAPPMAVTYSGARVTTAVPGKSFSVKFQVKNTGSSATSDVKVIFHIPDGLTHTKVSPADAAIEDGTITWSNQSFDAGKAMYPSFTFTLDSGTPLKTKKNIWVEVTGTDMEATSTNFSVTAVKATTTATKTTSTLSSTDITSMFETVYGRTPTVSEKTYWLGRRTDKPGRTALQGAMGYHQAMGIVH